MKKFIVLLVIVFALTIALSVDRPAEAGKWNYRVVFDSLTVPGVATPPVCSKLAGADTTIVLTNWTYSKGGQVRCYAKSASADNAGTPGDFQLFAYLINRADDDTLLVPVHFSNNGTAKLTPTAIDANDADWITVINDAGLVTADGGVSASPLILVLTKEGWDEGYFSFYLWWKQD